MSIQADFKEIGDYGCLFLDILKAVCCPDNRILEMYQRAKAVGALKDECVVVHPKMAALCGLKYLGDQKPSSGDYLAFAHVGNHWVWVDPKDVVIYDPLGNLEGRVVKPSEYRIYSL